MSVDILAGNVLETLPTIASGSIDCVVTSPPYWMLRSYLPNGHTLKRYELGSERTPQEYVANMVNVFALVREAMAEHATLWLNIGDTYSDGDRSGDGKRAGSRKQSRNCGTVLTERRANPGTESGQLCLIHQRLTLALQADGWIVRSIVVWHKPAPMPSSVRGWEWRRCRVKVKPQKRSASKASSNREMRPNLVNVRGGGVASATQNAEWSDCPGCNKCDPHGGYVLRRGSWRPTSSWEPIIMLAKSSRYVCDGEAVKQPAASATIERNEYTRVIDDPDEQFAVRHDHETLTTTANLRDVWTIAAEPLKEKHYAAFPTELVHRCLKSGISAKGYCPTCGGPWVRMIEAEKSFASGSGKSGNPIAGKNGDRLQGGGDTGDIRKGPLTETRTIGWRPSCRCPELPPRPGRVLDPFGGSGRTAVEAMRLGLDCTLCELNPDYVAMIRRKLRSESPLFAGV